MRQAFLLGNLAAGRQGVGDDRVSNLKTSLNGIWQPLECSKPQSVGKEQDQLLLFVLKKKKKKKDTFQIISP